MFTDREQELIDVARAIAPTHHGRVMHHVGEAINAFGIAAHHLSEATGWRPIGDGFDDELKGIADLLSDLRGKVRRMNRR